MGKFGDPTTEKEVRTAKRVNYLSLLFLFGLLATSFYFFLQLQEKQEELAEKTEMLADSTDNLQRIRAELEAAQNDLEAREESTLTVLRNVTQLVEDEDYGRAKEIAQEYEEWETAQRISLNVYSYGVGDSDRKAVQSYLQRMEHHVILNRNLTNPASWLQDSSTVLFYDVEMSDVAKRIANDLGEVTGEEFRIRMGSPGDAPKVEVRKWINIHHIEPVKMKRNKKRKYK